MAKKVLIVEDNELNMKLFHDLLEAQGYETLETREGLSALAMARQHMPDLILMDIQLPGMDGISALLRIREEPALDAVPVVAVSASVMPDDQRHIVSSGFDAYLTKPISLKPFLALVDRFLQDGRSR
jgi:two-component system cell cycle response regulator DivK